MRKLAYLLAPLMLAPLAKAQDMTLHKQYGELKLQTTCSQQPSQCYVKLASPRELSVEVELEGLLIKGCQVSNGDGVNRRISAVYGGLESWVQTPEGMSRPMSPREQDKYQDLCEVVLHFGLQEFDSSYSAGHFEATKTQNT